jgi:RNA polymerase-binding protein DksA
VKKKLSFQLFTIILVYTNLKTLTTRESEGIMTQEFIKEMEALLHEQKKTILESLASQSDEMRDLVKSVESGDEADVAADAIDRTLLTSLGSQDANRLKLIQNTFERISQGKYGYCVACGKEIPEERLRALPYALMCINCASAEERRNR